ncbi:SIMPL domain-containing protein [Oribacterium sp. NK2B42]|uniref:SIMPL domain-containing protein n=1 Tax=Oribacterium sp. NK2B42 TaxID=689781 RepID=UPI000405CCC3|nr:SIMPL domain-containing protein [Oribacterium sp. NK2B42]
MKNYRTKSFCVGLTTLVMSSALLIGCQGNEIPSIPIETQLTSSSAQADNIITVSASGKVTAVPDMAEITFSITTEDKDVKSAQNKNSQDADKVIDKLKELGVDEKSIKTSNYNIYPQYDYDAEAGNRISGYTVDTTLTVSDIKITDAGNVISRCVDAGINSMNNISYFCSGYDDAYNEALKEAVANADVKAQALAEASGKKIVEIKNIAEGYENTSLQYRSGSIMKNSLEAAADAVIMPGESDIEANVTVTYIMG